MKKQNKNLKQKSNTNGFLATVRARVQPSLLNERTVGWLTVDDSNQFTRIAFQIHTHRNAAQMMTTATTTSLRLEFWIFE